MSLSLHVKHLLTAYVHDELPPHLCERVVRHVNNCDSCYAALVRERDVTRTLAAEMPSFGEPLAGQLAGLLPDILAEVPALQPAKSHPVFSWNLPGFGIAVVVTVLLLLMTPALFMPNFTAVSAPDQPAPHHIVATATQSTTDVPVAIQQVIPTAVAVRLEPATEPPDMPVPELMKPD